MSQRRIHWLIAGLFLIPCAASLAHAEGQLREEVTTLESVYENRARVVLNPILRPGDYTLVVGLEMRDDPGKVTEFKEQTDVRFLPGLPVADDTFNAANNKLHELKVKARIHVILSDSVSADKDELVRDVLRSKLHLDEQAGDTVVVKRSRLPASEHVEASVLPELSWKMWALIIALGLMLVAAVAIWAMRRQPAAEEGINTDAEPEDLPDQAPQQATESEAEKAEKKVKWLIDEVLAIGMRYPQLASRTIEGYFEAGNERPVMLLFERMGWEAGRQVFGNMAPSVWSRIAQLIREKKVEAEITEYEVALNEVYRNLLAKALEKLGKDDENPFAFVFKLSEGERGQLLDGESATNVALLGLFCTGSQFSDLLSRLDPHTQDDIVLEMTRLKGMPGDAIRAAASSFQAKLETIKKAPRVDAEGAGIAADFLKAMPPEKEMGLFNEIASKNPEAAERIRRTRVQFDDLQVYPEELVKDAIDSFDVSVLVSALTDADQMVSARIISVMAPKKARMVEGDLHSQTVKPTAREIAQARRDLCLAVEKILAARQMSVAEVWAQIEAGGGAVGNSDPTRVTSYAA